MIKDLYNHAKEIKRKIKQAKANHKNTVNTGVAVAGIARGGYREKAN